MYMYMYVYIYMYVNILHIIHRLVYLYTRMYVYCIYIHTYIYVNITYTHLYVHVERFIHIYGMMYILHIGASIGLLSAQGASHVSLVQLFSVFSRILDTWLLAPAN